MATTIATISLSSSDILSSPLAFSTTSALSKAGNNTGLTKTTGLGKTNFTNDPIQSKVIYRSDDATTSGANKVYLKNMSTIPAEYFTIHLDEEELGRLYAGDWAFFPWNAAAGAYASFRLTLASTWAAGDTW